MQYWHWPTRYHCIKIGQYYWVPAIHAKATCHILYSNSLKWKLNIIPNWPNSGDPDFELNIKFGASVKRHDMMNLYVPRGSWEQNFDFFSLNNVTANLPTNTGHKIIWGGELKISLPRSCSPGKMNHSLLKNLMPEMCVGRDIRVAMITKNACTATPNYCNGTQTQYCALVSELHVVC